MSPLVASASLTGSAQSPVKTTWSLGLTLRAPRVKALMFRKHLRDRLGRDEAELAGFAGGTGDDAGHVLGLVDVTEIAPDVLGVCLPGRDRPQWRKVTSGYLGATFRMCGSK